MTRRTRFAYALHYEACYWGLFPDIPHISVMTRRSGGNPGWEITFTETLLASGRTAVHLRVADNSWTAFTQLPELFAALAVRVAGPVTIAEIRELLIAMDGTDETLRDAPPGYDITHREFGYGTTRPARRKEANRD
jgi:hypothetical protein